MNAEKNNQKQLKEFLEVLKLIEKEDIETIFNIIENFIITGDLILIEMDRVFETRISEDKIEDLNEILKQKYLTLDNINTFFSLLVFYIIDEGEISICDMFDDIDVDAKKSKSFYDKTKLIESLVLKKRIILDYILNKIFNKLNEIIEFDYDIPLRTFGFKGESGKKKIISPECELSFEIYNKKKDRKENLNFSIAYVQIRLFQELLEEIEKEFKNKGELIKKFEKEK